MFRVLYWFSEQGCTCVTSSMFYIFPVISCPFSLQTWSNPFEKKTTDYINIFVVVLVVVFALFSIIIIYVNLSLAGNSNRDLCFQLTYLNYQEYRWYSISIYFLNNTTHPLGAQAIRSPKSNNNWSVREFRESVQTKFSLFH